MSGRKVIAVVGYGPGISASVARKFGGEGFKVALLARSQPKLDAAATELASHGIGAQGFAVDAGDPHALLKVLSQVRDQLGPVTVLHWNIAPLDFKPLLQCSIDELQANVNIGVTSLLAAVQAVVPGFQGQQQPAILVTGGAFALDNAGVNDFLGAHPELTLLGVTKPAQHKAVELLHRQLKSQGIYVGEVMVTDRVKGTAFDDGTANILPSDIGDAFWKLYTERSAISITI